MPEKNYITELGNWQGFKAGTVERITNDNNQPEIWIELFPDKTHPMRCSGCDSHVTKVHDHCERWIDDLPAWDTATRLLVHLRRVRCPQCGPRMEYISWLEPYARITKRLAESIARLCDLLPIKQAAEFYGVAWHTAKRVHKHFIKERLGEVDLSDVKVIALDEFAIQKGHRYATVIVEPQSRRVLWVGRGRGREDIRPFFELLGAQCKYIEAAVMDMWEAYEQEVRMHCKNAQIVYDLFHVCSKYGRDVIDRVRISEAKRLANTQQDHEVIKGSKWLLLRNKQNLRHQDRIRLQELLNANKRLAIAYILKDDLKHLWDYKYEGAALNFWNQWYRRAMRSRIEPLKQFARKMNKRLHGILSHCRYPFNTSVLEGINNKIKVIKRMAYGFRDDDYFFLRIRHAFPGK